jgi:hypothetical protein
MLHNMRTLTTISCQMRLQSSLTKFITSILDIQKTLHVPTAFDDIFLILENIVFHKNNLILNKLGVYEYFFMNKI